jgi:UbiD family decarboxylase
MAFNSLREFIDFLKDNGELIEIDSEIKRDLEIGAVGELTRLGPAVLFNNIKGYDKRVAINILGTNKRIAMALGVPEENLVPFLAERIDQPVKPIVVSGGPCKENILKGNKVNLDKFPIPKWNDKDGGRFSDFGMVITKDIETGGQNGGMYRMHVKGKNKTNIFIQDKQHIGMHYKKCKDAGMKYMEMAVAIGLDPIVNMIAPSPIEYGVDELDVAGGLRGEPVSLVKCDTVDLLVPATAEIVLEGRVPIGIHNTEGPFGEFTGYYSGTYEHPIFEITCITHRDNPIFQGTYLGKPPTEGHIIPGVFNSAIFYKNAKKICPEITGVNVFGATWVYITAVSIKKEYEGQVHHVADALYSSGIGRYIKILVVVDHDVNVYNIDDIIWAISSRYQPEFDTYITPRVAGYGIDPSERKIGERGIETGGVSSLSSRILIDATVSKERPIMGERVLPPGVTEKVKERLLKAGIDLKRR